MQERPQALLAALMMTRVSAMQVVPTLQFTPGVEETAQVLLRPMMVVLSAP